MGIKVQIIILVIIIVALLCLGNMIRKKKVDLRYALPWIIMGCIMLVLDVFPQLLGKMATLLGFELPINMLFFFGRMFGTGNIVYADSCHFQFVGEGKKN